MSLIIKYENKGESQTLDYKERPYLFLDSAIEADEKSKDKSKIELLKDITAFLNTQEGGVIAIGFSNEGNPLGLTSDITARQKDEILQLFKGGRLNPLPDPDCLHIKTEKDPISNKFYWFIFIKSGLHTSPFFANAQGNSQNFNVPLRAHATTRYLTIYELLERSRSFYEKEH